MKEIKEISEFNKYVLQKQRSDTVSFYSIVLFLIMAGAIVLFAIKNHKLNQEKDKLSDKVSAQELYIKSLIAKTSDSLTIENLTAIDSFNKIKFDSLQQSLIEIKKLNDENLKFQKQHYEKLIAIAESRINEKDKVSQKVIEDAKEKTKTKIDEKAQKNNTEISNVIKKSYEINEKNNLYAVYIQYCPGKEIIANNIYKKLLKDKRANASKPELMNFYFPPVVKYFHDEDKSIADSFAKELKYSARKENSKAAKKQIEIWIGDFEYKSKN